MDQAFFSGNRLRIAQTLGDGEIALLFAGQAPRQSADQYYEYYANRNFVYLTGMKAASQGFILLIEKQGGQARDTLFLLPSDPMKERWTGRRIKPEEATEISGIRQIRFLQDAPHALHALLSSGRVQGVWLDLFKLTDDEADDAAHRAAQEIIKKYPAVRIMNLAPALRQARTIKQPCEIEAIRRAVPVTRAGILAMMRASKPGMYEYQYKALFDQALTDQGVLQPGFPSIIAAGKNNFCIHYYDYLGQAQDGDMILNDVGAQWDGMTNDVSRGWPCNGKFTEKQRLLYECAYETSNYMFSIIKPGMPMAAVDDTIRAYCGQKLIDIGLLDDMTNVGRYMWHGGAHHIGLDVHDQVSVQRDTPICPGMVFCVDVGIYVEEWGIGFRLEDNCLVTETGCENLTASIPRSIEEIEAVMRG